MQNNWKKNMEVSFIGKIKMITPDLVHKDGYDILLETLTEDKKEKMYMKMVLCTNFISYVEDNLKVGDMVNINGTLLFNSNEDGFGDPRLLVLVRNFRSLEEK